MQSIPTQWTLLAKPSASNDDGGDGDGDGDDGEDGEVFERSRTPFPWPTQPIPWNYILAVAELDPGDSEEALAAVLTSTSTHRARERTFAFYFKKVFTLWLYSSYQKIKSPMLAYVTCGTVAQMYFHLLTGGGVPKNFGKSASAFRMF